MSPRILTAVVALALATFGPSVARAGMPSFTAADIGRRLGLSELTRARLEAISFFLASLLVCAWVIQGLWNGLRKDFPRWPRLSFGKACGLIFLWGLLFVLVLTMVSGARELLTPGAWIKDGWTHRLANQESETATVEIAARHQAMERLRDALFRYAEQNAGAYPERPPAHGLPDVLRDVRTVRGQRYEYLGGRQPALDEPRSRAAPLLYEAETFGPDRLVILTDGSIVWMPVSEIEQAAGKRVP